MSKKNEKNFNSCVSNDTKKEKTFEEKLRENYLSRLYLYTWNPTCKTIEKSVLKYDGNKVLIDFDYVDYEKEGNFNYSGECTIEEHAIFINVTSQQDQDQCLIIFTNDKCFSREYEKRYFNIGIMLSYGRRSQFPEAKTIFAYQKELPIDSNSIIIKLVRDQLKQPNIDANFLKEFSRKN